MQDHGLAPRCRRLLLPYLVFVALVTVCYGYVNVRIQSDWAIGDWLINYRAGFIRRGLPGEVALRAGHLLHLPPMYIVLFMQLIFYAMIFYSVWRLLARSEWNLWVVAIVISPATLSFHLLDPTSGFRKEDIFFASLGMLLIILLRRRMSDAWLTVYLTMISLICTLSHESLLVFAPYLIAALAIGLQSMSRAMKISTIPTFATIAATALVVRHPGNYAMAQQICASLGQSASEPLSGVCHGSIAYLGRDESAAHAKVLSVIHVYHYAVLYPPLIVMAIIPIVMAAFELARHTKLHRDLWILAACASTSIAASSILFFYAIDWGRWIYIHIFSIFLLLLFIDHTRMRDVPSPRPIAPPTVSRGRRLIAVGLLVVYATCWDLPHVGIFQSRTGYFGLAHYFYRYRTHHEAHPNDTDRSANLRRSGPTDSQDSTGE
jgi:uncharacterized membrane protein